MRFLRFSVKLLLILTGLVAVALYLLLIRPVVLAKQVKYELETTTDRDAPSREYFDETVPDGATFEVTLDKRTWADVFGCRQNFMIQMVRPMPKNDKTLIALTRNCHSTPLGIYKEGGFYPITKQKR